MNEDEFEPARRELCPDGTCIGLIGPDGRCKVCGAVGASTVADPRHRGMHAPAGNENAGDSGLEDARELCPDGSCVGLIGPDRRCKVCGSPAREGADGETALESDPQLQSAEPSDEDEDEDDDRELCPDDSCIGLIGSDGRCKVCGTARRSPLP